jgi:hypothetical protein
MQMAGDVKMGCRGLRALPWLLLAWLLSSCGGGSSQIEPFQPQKMIFIGDETVGLLSDGRRYGINGLASDGTTIDCGANPIWSQQLASNFGFLIDTCSTTTGTPGITRAVPDAKVADLDGQISAQIATGVTSKDLFVVMVGMNDIIEVYETFVGDRSCNAPNNNPPANSMMAELAARGHLAAMQISRILDAGGRAIVSTVHDLGRTPYALTRGQGDLLTCMTAIFNARLRVDIRPLDGRLWGLVLADDNTLAVADNPSGFGLTNVSDPACAVAPPDCTTSTLVSGADSGNYLWADDRHFGPLLHNQLASQAITRARNNPF